MSNKIETGGAAFPCDLTMYDQEVIDEFQGMTLRDYFAAKVLPIIYQTLMEDALTNDRVFCDENWRVDLAMNVYKMADAMLIARKIK